MSGVAALQNMEREAEEMVKLMAAARQEELEDISQHPDMFVEYLAQSGEKVYSNKRENTMIYLLPLQTTRCRLYPMS